jgi:hypothetical protein
LFPLYATGIAVSTTPAVPVAKFDAGVVDTCDVVDTGGATRLANISSNF